MKTIADIKAIKEKIYPQIIMRDKNNAEKSRPIHKYQVLVCGGTGCHSNSSSIIYDEFNKILKEKGIENDVQMVMTGCFGLCAAGPVIIVYPEGAFYSKVQVEDVAEIIDEHICNGKIVMQNHHISGEEKLISDIKELSKFFR